MATQLKLFSTMKTQEDAKGWPKNENMVKYANQKYKKIVKSIHKLSLNTLNSWIFFILMIIKRKIFDFIA
jgi:cytochrome c biogenesis protein ResB